MKLYLVLLLLTGLVAALAEPEPEPQRATLHQIKRGVAGPNPYIFLSVPRGRSQPLIQGFEVIEGDLGDDDEEDDEADEPVSMKNRIALSDKHRINDDDDDDEAVDDDDEDEDVMQNNDDDDEGEDMNVDVMRNVMIDVDALKKNQRINTPLKNTKATPMMVSREHAGAILVPDEVIEIEGQSVIDEKTGKPALLLPRSILDSIPDGSVVALMERAAEGRSEEEERANRVIVRRRRRGSRRNVKRRRGGNRRRRRGGNRRRRRRNGKRPNVRVVRLGGNRRRGNNRRRVAYRG